MQPRRSRSERHTRTAHARTPGTGGAFVGGGFAGISAPDQFIASNVTRLQATAEAAGLFTVAQPAAFTPATNTFLVQAEPLADNTSANKSADYAALNLSLPRRQDEPQRQHLYANSKRKAGGGDHATANVSTQRPAVVVTRLGTQSAYAILTVRFESTSVGLP
jgi:hypothetical protein